MVRLFFFFALIFSASCSRSNPKIPIGSNGCVDGSYDSDCLDYGDNEIDDRSIGGDITGSSSDPEQLVDITVTAFIDSEPTDNDKYAPKASSACSYVDQVVCSSSSRECTVYSDNGSRADTKSAIWDEMYRLNESLGQEQAACRADIAVAMAMQEAHSFALNNGKFPYDSSKNSRTDGSQNVSLFNMNIDFIKRSCKSDCEAFQNFSDQQSKMYLNEPSYLREAIRRLSEGFDHFGIDGTLYFHRGGSTGYGNPTNDVTAFARKLKSVAGYLKSNASYRKNEARVAHNINQI